MAKRYPGASWQPLGAQSESRMHSHDIICVHTMVGSLAGTDAYFEDGGYGGTESHFGTGPGRGEVIQWQDLAFSADANLDGWHRVISIENADRGPGYPEWGGSNVPRFTDAQAAELVDLIAWLCSKEAHADCPSDWACHRDGIPARLIEDTKPGRRGIAFHRQGCDGNFPGGIYAGRVPGGERWSSSPGKVCPGDRRIAQTVNEIIPAVQARLTDQEDIMATKQELAELLDEKLAPIQKQSNKNGRLSYRREVSIAEAIEAVVETLEVVAGQTADAATKAQVRKLRSEVANLRTEIAAEQPEAGDGAPHA